MGFNGLKLCCLFLKVRKEEKFACNNQIYRKKKENSHLFWIVSHVQLFSLRQIGFKVNAGLSGGAFQSIGQIEKPFRITAEFVTPNCDGNDVTAVLPLLPIHRQFAQIVFVHEIFQKFKSPSIRPVTDLNIKLFQVLKC